ASALRFTVVTDHSTQESWAPFEPNGTGLTSRCLEAPLIITKKFHKNLYKPNTSKQLQTLTILYEILKYLSNHARLC
ncbi:MAG: hypothetical protein QXR70_03825, partial [Sulfolobales archaeon]